MRKIKIIGSIDSDNYNIFVQEMDVLEEKSTKPIHIELSSEGGDTYIGLAYYGRIISSPCDIIITAYGQVMSAATIILAAGDRRRMHKEAWFMVHDDSTKVRENTKITADIIYDHMENVEQQWASILAKHSNQSKELWRKASKDTTYLNAESCLFVGLVDEVF